MTRSLSKVSNRSDLARVQRVFFDIITRPLLEGDRLAPDSRIDRMIAHGPKLDPAERLELYARQYWWRVLDSLREDFPGVVRFLGEKRFSALSVRYLIRHKSKSFTLRHLGRNLERFIRTDAKIPVKLRGPAADIAALEWAQMEVFEAADLAPLTPAELTDPEFPRWKLVCQPSIRLLELASQADDWVEEGRDDFLRDSASNTRLSGRASTAKSSRATSRKVKAHLAVYRLGFRIRFRRLTPAMFRLLQEFQEGGTIEAVLLRTLRAKRTISEEDVTLAFKEFVSLGWLARSPTATTRRSIQVRPRG